MAPNCTQPLHPPRIPSDLLSFSEDLLQPGEAATAAKKLEIVKGQVAQMNGILGVFKGFFPNYFPVGNPLYTKGIYREYVVYFWGLPKQMQGMIAREKRLGPPGWMGLESWKVQVRIEGLDKW